MDPREIYMGGSGANCDVAFNWSETDSGVNIDQTNIYSFGSCVIDHGYSVAWMMANGDTIEYDFVDELWLPNSIGPSPIARYFGQD